jgi:hypothetical protein
LEELWKGLLGAVELVPVNEETIGMGILSGLDCGSHRTADRVGDVALLEEHTVFGKGVDVRGRTVFLEPGIVGPNCLIGMIVGEYE